MHKINSSHNSTRTRRPSLDAQARKNEAAAARKNLVSLLQRICAPSEARVIADDLLKRIEGPHLNLAGLDPQALHCVQHMQPEAWAALQAHARSKNGLGITSFALSSRLVVDDSLKLGMQELTTLGFHELQLVNRTLDSLRRAEDTGRAEVIQDALEPLLAKAHSPELDDELQAWITEAMKCGRHPSAQAYADAVLASPLNEERKLQLLLAHSKLLDAQAVPATKLFVPELAAFVEEAAGGHVPPMLHQVCESFAPTSRHAMAQYQSIRRFLHAVVDSGLSMNDKTRICASRHPGPDGETAAQLAMRRGHPAGAGIMIVAILETFIDWEDKADLLDRLGVSMPDVLSGIDRSSMRLLGNRIREGVDTLTLLKDGGWVALTDFPDTLLMAEEMWVADDHLSVRCSATREIPALASLQTWPADGDASPHARPFCYAIPPRRLRKVDVPERA